MKTIDQSSPPSSLILLKNVAHIPTYMSQSAYKKTFSIPTGELYSARLNELRNMAEGLFEYLSVNQCQEIELSNGGITLFLLKKKKYILVDTKRPPLLVSV